jgi:hypothetical protein
VQNVELYLSNDGVGALLVLVFAVGQAAMAAWPELRKWPETIASRSMKLQNPLVPIDWAFAIWGLIFSSIVAFAVWQALPANVADPLARSIRWLAIAAFAVNMAWEAWVPKRDLDWVSVPIIWIELALLLTILFMIARTNPQGTTFWIVFAPFQLFAGWVSAAVFVNTASTLQRSGMVIGRVLSIAMMVLAGILASTIAGVTGGWIYAGAVAWALLGIVVANTTRDRDTVVATFAGILAVAVLVAPALS